MQQTTASNRRTMNSLERRKRYQELIDQGHDLALRTQTQKAIDIFQGVSSILMQTNSLMQQGIEHERMDNASEVCMNVQVVKMSHDLVGAALQQNESSQFCDEEFAAAIMTYVGSTDSQEGWEAIGEGGITAFRMSKHSPCLLGTFNFQSVPMEKVVKERRRRQRQELGEARKPETVHKLNQEEADARKLQDIMEQLKNIYEERGSSIPYFELVTDPTDYMCTVDTAFQISFLIRDGAVALETVGNVLRARPTTDLEKKQSKSSDDNIQAILSLNWTQWKNAIKQYRLTRPLLTIDRDMLDESNAGQ
ncbi:EP300-interacting inhibitor of differentiation 3 [Anopheles ziemanni]|uniref:EP300-interacting inhibitor of differentiation 3 n=1 Tax=Anopheles coustani TaxID=139045 RepID=UPI002659749B|nr:EP300-interacting inhibitor of differentiation 3 [Anopheles coustani]XP_058167967.1 EP300-interacting inhibitor of differentiation 3 [Anopheles ziemanni]